MAKTEQNIEGKTKAGGKGKIHEHPNAGANDFSKRPQDAGRPKKIYTILKELGYSKDDIGTAFGELVFYTIPDLRKLDKDAKVPVIVRIVSKALIEAHKTGDWRKIKEIMEYVMGKPISKTELAGEGGGELTFVINKHYVNE